MPYCRAPGQVYVPKQGPVRSGSGHCSWFLTWTDIKIGFPNRRLLKVVIQLNTYLVFNEDLEDEVIYGKYMKNWD